MRVANNRSLANDILFIIGLFPRENDQISEQVPYIIFIV